MTYSEATKTARTMTRGNATYQQDIIASLLSGNRVHTPSYTCRGRAKQYIGRYAGSFCNAIAAIEKAGYKVIRTPGPRGGEWGATYCIN